MRWIVMGVVILLIQTLSYALAIMVHWLTRPVVTVSFLPLLIGCLIISNGLVFGSMALGLYRLSAGWLAMLWISALSAVMSAVVIGALKQSGIGLTVASLAQLSEPILYRLISVMGFLSLLGLSVYNAYTPTTRHLTITLDKPMPAPVTLAVASDLHLGALVGNRQLILLEQLLTKHQVDILLMPGDIMDDNTIGFERYQMAKQLKRTLSSVSSVSIASLGNHDLYQKQAYKSINQAIKEAGAIVLSDESIQIMVNKHGQSTTLTLIGRYDDHYTHRKSTDELISQVNLTYPVILLDHRPSEIEHNSTLPIDLQVSGHTHNGQVFPANLIVKAINKIGYGYKKINQTHFVVSSGYGFWGVPFRLGSQSEIWVINLVGQ